MSRLRRLAWLWPFVTKKRHAAEIVKQIAAQQASAADREKVLRAETSKVIGERDSIKRRYDDEAKTREQFKKDTGALVERLSDIKCFEPDRDYQYRVMVSFSPELVGFGSWDDRSREVISREVSFRVARAIEQSKFVRPPDEPRRSWNFPRVSADRDGGRE